MVFEYCILIKNYSNTNLLYSNTKNSKTSFFTLIPQKHGGKKMKNDEKEWNLENEKL
jgi:hypothetical protein